MNILENILSPSPGYNLYNMFSCFSSAPFIHIGLYRFFFFFMRYKCCLATRHLLLLVILLDFFLHAFSNSTMVCASVLPVFCVRVC